MGTSFVKIKKMTIEQVTLLKGIGILLIVLHNFWHWVPPTLGENEFSFDPNLFQTYIDHFLIYPEQIIPLLFSFFGYMGVYLFIFLSVYGISISLNNNPRSYYNFMYRRFSTLYISFLICLVFYVVVRLTMSKMGLINGPDLQWNSIFFKLLLISNFIPGEALSPVGPWWFIPFIFQTYLILPVLIKLYQKCGDIFLILIAISGVILEVFYPFNFPNLNFSPLGYMPLICLGIFTSFKEEIKIQKWLLALIMIIYCASQFLFPLWIISDVLFTIIVISIANHYLFERKSHKYTVKLFMFLGSISLHLFLVNGFLRRPFYNVVVSFESWWVTILMGIAFLLFSILIAFLLGKVENRARLYIKKMAFGN